LDVGLGVRPVEGHPGAEFLRGVLGSLVDRLPELVLEALGDDGDVRLLAVPATAPSGAGTLTPSAVVACGQGECQAGHGGCGGGGTARGGAHRNSFVRGGWIAAQATALEAPFSPSADVVGEDGVQDDDADRDLLPLLRHGQD